MSNIGPETFQTKEKSNFRESDNEQQRSNVPINSNEKAKEDRYEQDFGSTRTQASSKNASPDSEEDPFSSSQSENFKEEFYQNDSTDFPNKYSNDPTVSIVTTLTGISAGLIAEIALETYRSNNNNDLQERQEKVDDKIDEIKHKRLLERMELDKQGALELIEKQKEADMEKATYEHRLRIEEISAKNSVVSKFVGLFGGNKDESKDN